jgi:hypothetical protein
MKEVKLRTKDAVATSSPIAEKGKCRCAESPAICRAGIKFS